LVILNTLNTHIYHQLPPSCFGVFYTVFREIITLSAQELYVFSMILHRLCFKMYFIYI
jgi:hypothetical protein